MAIWKEQTSTRREPSTLIGQDTVTADEDNGSTTMTPVFERPRRAASSGAARESVIAADLTIEGKIEGTGHVRLAGQFKGDVNVEGNLTIEQGAKVTGGVRAQTVVIAGELEGNVDSAVRVELLETGVLVGDVKAGTLTVAAGSRMRGRAEFGWEGGNGSGFGMGSIPGQ